LHRRKGCGRVEQGAGHDPETALGGATGCSGRKLRNPR
jgi:hypothetical protein